MAKKSINPDSLFASQQYGFSQIVVAQGNQTVYFSGQVAWDKDHNIVGENDLRAQVWQSLENLKIAVTVAGGTLEDIVAMRIYIVHNFMEDSECISEALKNFFPGKDSPAATWVGISSLARPEFLVEIEATAVLD